MTEKSKDNPQRSDSEVYTIASVFVAGNFAAANRTICAWKNVTHGKKLRYGLILPRWPSMDFLLIDAPRFASFYPEPLFTGRQMRGCVRCKRFPIFEEQKKLAPSIFSRIIVHSA